MKKELIAKILVIITAFSFLFSYFPLSKIKNPIKNFPSVYNVVDIIIETKTPDKITVKKDNELYKGAHHTLTGKIKSLKILKEKDAEIENIVVFNDVKPYYFTNSDLKNSVEFDLGSKIKANKNSDCVNLKSYLNVFCILFLSFFTLKFCLVLPYLLLFFTIFYFINNKIQIKIYAILPFIFVIGILLRYNTLFDYHPWLDEYFSMYFSNPNAPIGFVADDSGNPPLFYMFFRVYLSIFKTGFIQTALFPFLIGTGGFIVFYFVLKKMFDKKTAIIGAFLYSVNLPLIYYSNEIRSYILQAFFTPLIVYFLFKILKTGKTKDYIFYLIFSSLAVNIHFFEILFIAGNFIFALIYFLKEKRYEEVFKFVICNLYIGISFLPFFNSTAVEIARENVGFNDWIKPFDIFKIKEVLFYITGGGVSLVLSVLFFIKNLIQKEKTMKDEFIIYSFFIISVVFIFALLISNLIRPIATDKYFTLLIPLFISFIACVFTNKYKNKFVVYLFIIWFLFIQTNSDFTNNKRLGVIDFPLVLSYEYKKRNPNENVYAIINSAFHTDKYHRKYISDKITYFEEMRFLAEDTVQNILDKDKNAVIFTKQYNLSNGTCYFNSATSSCVYKIKKM